MLTIREKLVAFGFPILLLVAFGLSINYIVNDIRDSNKQRAATLTIEYAEQVKIKPGEYRFRAAGSADWVTKKIEPTAVVRYWATTPGKPLQIETWRDQNGVQIITFYGPEGYPWFD